jgi:archaellum component FlaG (FlaF/FlaG flagellin family)
MSNVIVAALLLIGAGIAASIVIVTQGPALEMSIDSVIQSQSNVADMIRSDIEIVSAEAIPGGQTIVAWVKNTGNLNIKPVSSLDIILKRVDQRRSEYIPYGAPTGNTWSVLSPGQGVWHQRETLQVQITLAVPLTSGVYILSVTTPQGVTDDQSFEMAALDIPVPRVRHGVVFTSYSEGNADIYTMREYGTDITKPTENPAGDWKALRSPNGDKIACESCRDGNLEIYVMEAYVSNQTRIMDNNRDNEAAVLSPGGSKIAFHLTRAQAVMQRYGL